MRAPIRFTDSLTWTKGKHTFKFGVDWRYLSSLNTQVFNDYRMGQYQFNGSVDERITRGGAAVPLASFLLGYPDLTTIANVHQPEHRLQGAGLWPFMRRTISSFRSP